LKDGLELVVELFIPSKAILLEQDCVASNPDIFAPNWAGERFAFLCNRPAYQTVVDMNDVAG